MMDIETIYEAWYGGWAFSEIVLKLPVTTASPPICTPTGFGYL
jgi:hypothetical protein